MEITGILTRFVSSIPEGAPRISGLSGSSPALFLALRQEPFIAVEKTEEEAIRLFEDIRFFLSLIRASRTLHFLPEPNGPESSGRRAEVVRSLKEGGSVVTSLKGFGSPVWNYDDLLRNSLDIAAGREMDRGEMKERLETLGYRRVSLVMEKGEYRTQGWIMDIFPSTQEHPVRVEFFGDEIESIKSFDIDSQRSFSRKEHITVMPVGEPPAGSTIHSLARARTFFIDPPGEASQATEDAVFLSRMDVKGGGYDAGVLSLRGLGIHPDERGSLSGMASALKDAARDRSLLIVSSSEGQAERVKDILFEGGVVAPVIETEDIAQFEGPLAITKGRLSSGLFLKELLLLTEREIFGERPPFRALKKSKVSHLLATIDDISPGDLVVHRDHGIGRFVAMQKERTGDAETDLIVLEYAGKDRLYIPLYNIDRIKKYNAETGAAPLLDKLGGKTWERRKERVRKAVHDMAEKLLKLYAEREVAKSFSFSTDTELHHEFYEFFPYEETPDQVKAIEEISRDMESDRPMDRLLCGDVGYGKTEVAMRAAFKAVYDGKQVAVLVPTTILCEQHLLTFTSRFSAFPVRIDYLSRFKQKRDQALTLKALARGEVDIIIGTHGLLRRDISFSNLGLLIVDEEHRFGVGQKERIKEMKKGVDVLSMTATPIPRTLHMAISGIRSLSIIETPPEERLAVRSIVSIFDETLIREAAEREFQRGGQVLFVHNTVFDIEKMAERLKRLFPGRRFGIAHGQMAERRLEGVMMDFMKGRTDILVSTTIIGSGIDIPTANTIIINRADKIGLSDLYQLRGRVGRSNVKAYAYFLIPGTNLITEEGKKRLQAILDMSYLGAGFRLAMRDLEMRGAGNLLGPEQSGHIHAVGFDLYVEMLENAVADLKGLEVREEVEPSISLKLPAFIPEGYIEDMTLRLSIYRRIAVSRRMEELEDIASEMKDRFGNLPGEVKGLLEIMRLKIVARRLAVANISEANGKVRIAFSKVTPVEPERILALQETSSSVRFYKDGFEIGVKGLSGSETCREIQRVMSRLSL